jgi:LacI family transcriptional regulator
MSPQQAPPKRVTLTDVATDAGVSRATASLVLRGSPLVADQTRDRVLVSMHKLGYVYNRAAASLRTHQSHTIGLVVTDITNPFFAQMTVGSEAHLEAASYAALLANTSETLSRQDRLLETMHGYGVDGILLCPAMHTSLDTIDRSPAPLGPALCPGRALPVRGRRRLCRRGQCARRRNGGRASHLARPPPYRVSRRPCRLFGAAGSLVRLPERA